MRFLSFLLISLTFISPAYAQEKPVFGWPIDCTLNKDCWFMNYVDMDSKPYDHEDPYCNERGYDDHKGTDIAIQSGKTIEEGVDVLASLNGTISRLRDGEPDRFPTRIEMDLSRQLQKECGNAVLIDHGNSLQTIYCHLKKDSITVKSGETVKQGDKIGEIGLSGLTEFPHLHFGITWEGAIMDPFTGRPNTEGCQANAASVSVNSMWQDPEIQYTDTSLYHAGFYNGEPLLDEIDRGKHMIEKASQNEDAIAFWFSGFGLRDNDEITISISAPNGDIFSRYITKQKGTRARQFYYTGKRTHDLTLDTGIYVGKAIIKRDTIDGLQRFEITRELEVLESN